MWPTSDHIGITTPYGKPGSWWATGEHGGADFGCPTGSPVYAMWSGQVLSPTWGSAYGTQCVIRHDPLPDGTPSRCAVYAHLLTTSVDVGQRVTAGQHIGTSDNTGNSSGAHLHVEVQPGPGWQSGTYIDPQPWLDAGAEPAPEDTDMARFVYVDQVVGRTIAPGEYGSIKWESGNPRPDSPTYSLSLGLGQGCVHVVGVVSVDRAPDWIRVAVYAPDDAGQLRYSRSLGPAQDAGDGVISIARGGQVDRDDVLRLEVKAGGSEPLTVLPGTGILSAVWSPLG